MLLGQISIVLKFQKFFFCAETKRAIRSKSDLRTFDEFQAKPLSKLEIYKSCYF